MGGKSSTISTSEQRILSLQVQQSSYGLTLPVVFGQNRLAGNLIDYTDFTAIATTTRTRSGGKGGGGKVTQEDTKYTYEAAVIMGLCHGQIAGVVSYWRDKDRHFDLSELSLTLMSGSHTQAPWAYMQGKHPERAITYADTAYLCSPNYSLGSNAQVPNHSFEVAGLRQIGSGNPDAAADQVLQDMLTNADWAAAFPAQRLAPLDDYRNYTRANGLFLSPVLQEQQEAREHISLLLEQTNSAPVWSNDQLKIIPYGDEAVSGNGASYTPNLTPVYDLTVDDFLADEGEPPLQIERISQADRKNRVVVEYLDRANAYNIATASAQDQTSIARDGYRPMEPLRMHGICRGDVAQKVAQLRLQRSLYIANEYEFRLGWKYALLEPMDVVTLTEPGLGLNRLPVRITRIEEDVAGTLTVAAEDFPAGVGTAKVAPGQPSLGSSTNFNAAPGSAYAPVIFEAPLQITNNEPQLWLATAGGPDWGGCSVWISLDGDSYRKIGQMAGKSRYGSTTAALALGPAIDSAQLLRVDISASGGQLLGGTQADAQAMVTACYVDGEYISYATAALTGAGRYNLGYLVRGGYGSNNVAHAAGSQFVRLTDPLFKGALPADWLGKTIRVKLTSFNVFGGAEQSLADVPAYSYTVIGAPMGAVQNLRIMSTWSLGRDAKIGWDVLPGADSYDVEVLNGSTRVRLVQGVVDNMYTYTPQDQRADGGPWRNLVIRVRGRAVTGKTGAWSQIVASNPQAAAPVAVDLKPGIKSAFLQATPPADDDIAGLMVWLSTDPACPAVAANLVYDGIPALVTLSTLKNGTALSGATDYYVRCAFYDTFGKDALNTSTPVKFRPWEVSQIAKDLDVMNLSAAMQREIAKGQTALDGVSDLQDVYGDTVSAAQSAADAIAAKIAAMAAEDGAVSAKDSAELAKTNAETAAGNASTSATQASQSAQSASGSASQASTQADTAAQSATAAGSAATAASGSASQAGTYATQAGQSASAASTSATNASTAAGNASSYASQAASSAATAGTKAGEAASSANSASSSAGTAATSATNASNHATAAQTSANTASTKASDAAQSAASASTSATTAGTKAGEASVSASSAASSASNAAGSALQAATTLTQVQAMSKAVVGEVTIAAQPGVDLSLWQNIVGSGEIAVVGAPTANSGYAIQFGNNSGNDQYWGIHRQLIQADDSLICIKLRYRRTAGAAGVTLGLTGVAQDGVTLVNAAGENNHSGQHHSMTAPAFPAIWQWVDHVAYFRKGGSGNGSSAAQAAALHRDVKFVRPHFISNDGGQTGRTELEYFRVEVLSTPLMASITTVQTAITDLENNKASAQSVQTLESTVGTHTSQIQTTQEVVDGVSALTMFRQSVGGRVAGMGIASELINGKPATAVAFETDALKIYMPGKGDMPLVAADTRNSGVFGINGNLVVNGAGIFNSIEANSIDMAFAKAGTLNVNTLTSGLGGGNLLENAAIIPSYTDELGDLQAHGFPRKVIPVAGSWTRVNHNPEYYDLGNINRLCMYRPYTTQTGHVYRETSIMRVLPNTDYEYSAWGGGQNAANSYMLLVWVDAAGAEFRGGNTEIYFPIIATTKTFNYVRKFAVARAPANAVGAYLRFGIDAHVGSSHNYAMFAMPYFGVATGPNQSQPSPWSPSGFGTQIHGGAIKAKTVAADALSVTQLSAISANMGAITAGSINIGNGTAVIDSAGNVTANSFTAPGMTAKNGKLTINELEVIEASNIKGNNIAASGIVTRESQFLHRATQQYYGYLSTTFNVAKASTALLFVSLRAGHDALSSGGVHFRCLVNGVQVNFMFTADSNWSGSGLDKLLGAHVDIPAGLTNVSIGFISKNDTNMQRAYIGYMAVLK